MARQPINIGRTPGDGTGDLIHDAFAKVNANEAELYAQVGQAVMLDANGNANIPGALKINGTTVLSGPIQPVANAASGQEGTQLNALLTNMRAAGLLATTGGPVLAQLSLTNASIASGSPQNTVVGNIVGLTGGSTPQLLDNAGGRFALSASGTQIVTGATATNFSAATSHSITIREVLTNASNSPRDTVLTITVTQAAVTLVPLSLSNSTIASGSSQNTVVGNIVGLTSGSTPTLTNSAGSRFAIVGDANSGYQVVAGSVATNYSAATSHSITISEALAGAKNTPNSTTLTITVTQAQTAPAITGLTVSNTTPKVGDILTTNVVATGNPTPTLAYQWSKNNAAISGATQSSYTVQAGDAGATLTVTVTASNGISPNAVKTSAATAAVSSGATQNTYPSAATTGVQPGITLTPHAGDLTISTAGATVQNLDITGAVTITANNVTLKNCRITKFGYAGVSCGGPTGVVVTHCTINGGGSTSGSDGITGDGTFSYNDISGVENAINLEGGDGSIIRGNYIHDLAAPGSDPHYDGIQVMGGNTNVLIEGNTILSRDTSCVMVQNIFGAINGVHIRNNYCGGTEGYPLYYDGSKTSTKMLNCVYENNYLCKGGYGYIYVTADSAGNTPVDSNNSKVSPGLPPDQAPWIGDPIVGEGSASTTLGSLSLSSTSASTSAAQGAVIATISGKAAGSTLALTNTAGNKYALSGSSLVRGTTALTAGTDAIAITETLSGASNSPKVNNFSITVSNTTPTLQTLSLANASISNSANQGAIVGAINGLTAGSSITLTNDDGGHFAISGTSIVRGATALAGLSGSRSITIQETLAGATGSPKSTTLTINVTAASASAIWQPNVPAGTDNVEATNIGIQLSTACTANADIQVYGIWFYRTSASAATTVTATLHDSNLQELSSASATVSGVGWTYIALPSPVTITSGSVFYPGWWQPLSGGNLYYRTVASQFSKSSADGKVTATAGAYHYATDVAPPNSATTSSFLVEAQIGAP